MNKQIMIFRKQLQEVLKPARYEHSLSVSYICIALAMRYDVNLEKAEIAGILHDCAKRYEDRELIDRCRINDIPLSEDELLAPAVIHAKYGAWMAQYEYGIADPEILSAIYWHTTGCADMSILDKILFIADYIEPRRDKAANLAEIRKTAFISLDNAMSAILAGNMEYLNREGKYIDSRSKEAYTFYSASIK